MKSLSLMRRRRILPIRQVLYRRWRCAASVKDLTQAAILLSAPKRRWRSPAESTCNWRRRKLETNDHADIGVVIIGIVGRALSCLPRKAGIRVCQQKRRSSVQAQNDLIGTAGAKSIEILVRKMRLKSPRRRKSPLTAVAATSGWMPVGWGPVREYNVKAGYYGRKPKAKRRGAEWHFRWRLIGILIKSLFCWMKILGNRLIILEDERDTGRPPIFMGLMS